MAEHTEFICGRDLDANGQPVPLRPEVRAELDLFAEWLKLPRPRVPFQQWRATQPEAPHVG